MLSLSPQPPPIPDPASSGTVSFPLEVTDATSTSTHIGYEDRDTETPGTKEMIRLALLALALLVGPSAALHADEPAKLPASEKFHLYLLVGQSNMAGRGKVEEPDKKPHHGCGRSTRPASGGRASIRFTSTNRLPASAWGKRSPRSSRTRTSTRPSA